jgi:hypothetical protein
MVSRVLVKHRARWDYRYPTADHGRDGGADRRPSDSVRDQSRVDQRRDVQLARDAAFEKK